MLTLIYWNKLTSYHHLLQSQDSFSASQECCQKRRVGSDVYILVNPQQEQVVDMAGCLNNCAYRFAPLQLKGLRYSALF